MVFDQDYMEFEVYSVMIRVLAKETIFRFSFSTEIFILSFRKCVTV